MSNKLIATLIGVAAMALTVPLIGRTENIIRSVLPESTLLESRRGEDATTSSTEDEPRVVSLQVTPNGFEPNETIVPRGKLLILLQNRTGRRDLNFWLGRENEGRLAESEPQRRDWKAHVNLSPGTYIIGETNHPEWKSIIRVTN